MKLCEYGIYLIHYLTLWNFNQSGVKWSKASPHQQKRPGVKKMHCQDWGLHNGNKQWSITDLICTLSPSSVLQYILKITSVGPLTILTAGLPTFQVSSPHTPLTRLQNHSVKVHRYLYKDSNRGKQGDWRATDISAWGGHVNGKMSSSSCLNATQGALFISMQLWPNDSVSIRLCIFILWKKHPSFFFFFF